MSYPVTFEMDYVEQRSRVTTFFRYFLAIPQFIFAFFYMIAFFIVEIAAWFVLMFTARWPTGLYEFSGGFLRYLTRVNAYVALGVDAYPPFNGNEDDNYPVRVHIAPPLDHYSRVKVFFRPLYAIVAIVIRYAMQIVISVVAFVSWFVIVFTGNEPAALQNALDFSFSYTTKADALLFLITETYPPFPETGSVASQSMT